MKLRTHTKVREIGKVRLSAINDHRSENAQLGDFGWAWETIYGARCGGCYVLTRGNPHPNDNIGDHDGDWRYVVARFGPYKADYELLQRVLMFLQMEEGKVQSPVYP